MGLPDPGLYDHVPSEDYHPWPALGSTDVKVLATRTPAHYRYHADHPREASAAMDLGSLVHALVLDPAEADRFICQPPEIKVRRGKKWDAFVEENAGRTIVKAGDWEKAKRMRDALLANPQARAMLTNGRCEVSFRWDDPETGAPCKGRADSLPTDGALILPGADGPIEVPLSDCAVDLKTTASADPSEWTSRSMERIGYHIQGGHYLRGLRYLGETSRQWWAFVVVESAPPHLIAFYALDRRSLAAGGDLAAFACRRYVDCVEADEWPGYGDGVRMIGLSDFAISAAMMRANDDTEEGEIAF